MANERKDSERHHYISLDSDPGADYFTTEIGVGKKVALFVSVKGEGGAAITLQYKSPESGADWTDYADSDLTFETGGRYRIDDFGAGTRWRVGVKNGEYTGAVEAGIDW